MKKKFRFMMTLVMTVLFCATTSLFAATLYVGTEGSAAGNYYTVIQDAVDAAIAGDVVLVSNGVYDTGGAAGIGNSNFNRVNIRKSITLKSVDGPDSTFIVGESGSGTDGFGAGATRCVSVWGNYNAKVIGFTLTNGYTSDTGNANEARSGGGIYLRDPNTISNCVIVDCHANGFGGGALLWVANAFDCEFAYNDSGNYGGAIFCDGPTKIMNCDIHDNYSGSHGGGLCCWIGDIISNTAIYNNEAEDRGGAIWMLNNGDFYDCNIYSNTANNQGGGIYFENSSGAFHRCKILANESLGQNGGGTYIFRSGFFYDSLFSANQAVGAGGGIFFDNGGEVYNCTIVANSAMASGGGINMYVTSNIYSATIVNSIIYTNVAWTSDQNWGKGPGGFSPFNCTGPRAMEGDGNISNNPEFVSIELGDWNLMVGLSPCINAGTNGAVTSTIDLNGNPRIEGDNVDMGCYEAIPEPCLFIIFSLPFILYYLKKN